MRTPEAKRDAVAIRETLATLGRYLDIAELRLASLPYLAREHFALADIQFGHCLFRRFDIDIERAEPPALRRYNEGLTGRPAFREPVIVSHEELRDRL